MPNPDTYGIYLHIPYCRSKCRYCDFYSTPGTRGVPDEYVTALLRELSKSSRRPDTLYFGGGTPALLRPDQVHRLIKAAAPLPGAEITLEANPDVVTPENLAGFAAAGVTRISFGVQSADNAQLRRLGRTHTAAAAAQAFAWAREAGFREICGDIMLALPYYSIAEFDKTLALLQAGGCTHISAYLLKIEPGTAFGRTPPPGLPDADAAVWRRRATGNTRSAILPAPATKGGTICCIGTVKITGALVRRPTAAWAVCAAFGPMTPLLLLPGLFKSSTKAPATPRIT